MKDDAPVTKRGKPSRAVKRMSVTDRLYKAVLAYVEAYGGSVVVIGGVAIVRESPREFNYGLMVRCTGKLPVFQQK